MQSAKCKMTRSVILSVSEGSNVAAGFSLRILKIMFTGIVEEIGNVLNVSKQSNNVRLKIAANKILEDMEIGSSISINGVCLTAVKFKKVVLKLM